MQGQLEKEENKMLRGENEALKAEHHVIKAALLNKACPTCGGPMVPREVSVEKQRLFLENVSLREQVFHKTSFLNLVSGKAPMAMPGDTDGAPPDHTPMDTMPQGCERGSCAVTAKEQRTALFARVLRARDEFMMLAKKDTTLWLPTLDGEVIDYQRYHEVSFPAMLGLCPVGFGPNATRDSGMVMGTGAQLISILTDAVTHTPLYQHPWAQ